MFKRRQIVMYALLGIMVALITSTALADANSDCVAGCLQTLSDNMVMAGAVAAAAMAICLVGCFFFPGCALCALGVAAGLAVTMGILAAQCQACIGRCPPPTTPAG